MAKNNSKIESDELYTLNSKELTKEFKERRERFIAPRDFKIRFPIIMFCKYCHRPFIVFIISFFEDYCVCNCSKCGGRHTVSESDLNSYKKLMTILMVILILITLLFILI